MDSGRELLVDVCDDRYASLLVHLHGFVEERTEANTIRHLEVEQLWFREREPR